MPVTNDDGPITKGFPLPPPIIQWMLLELQVAALHPPESTEELRQLEEMPRPWDLPTCPPETQRCLWRWLDQVAPWITEERTWRVERIIPICWKQHPHIAHELTAMACLQVNASYAYVPDPLEDGHKMHAPDVPRPDRAASGERWMSSGSASAESWYAAPCPTAY